MKAIILAAGIGSRLKPITDKKPKTMVKVNGKPMLGYLLDNLQENKIKEIVICVGYLSDQIIKFCKMNYPHLKFHFVENSDFRNTNNMYSLYLAKEHFNEDIILMNADLVYDPEIILGIKKEQRTCIAVDKGNYIEESMKITLGPNKSINSISKEIPKEKAYGCSIDIYKINKEDLVCVLEEMKDIIEVKKDLNQWTELMLNNLLSSGKIKASPYDIGNSKWFEIDTFEDLTKAEILFNEGLRKIKEKKIFFLDGDGTLYLGKNEISGAKEFIRKLKEKNKIVYLLTNNSSKSPLTHYERLRNLDLQIDQNEIYVSIQSALEFFKKNKITEVFWVANQEVAEFIRENGFNFNDEDPQAILLTYDTEITYEKLKKLTSFVRSGIPYYATHLDIVCPTSEGAIPDIGSFIELLRLTTGKIPIKTFGKPSKCFIDPLLKKNNLNYSDAVIIGDRLYTDIKLKNNTNATSVLVLTGETNRILYEESKIKADIVINNISELVDFI